METPLEQRSGGRDNGGLDLPPVYRAVALRERGDAFAHAQRVAGEMGAGTLVWVRRFDMLELALVLEPEEPLIEARRALYAVMNAAGDALAAYCPPERPITFAWPDTILLDGGIIGGARLAWPQGAAEDEAPPWLVAALTLRSMVPLAPPRRGGHALDQPFLKGTSLESEGFEVLDAGQLIASFARHLMVHVDQWQEKGFVPVGQSFLGRLIEEKGAKRGLDRNGDLLVRRLTSPKEVERQPLLDRLAAPQWLDPETGEPWL